MATTEPIAPDLRATLRWMDTGRSVDERVDLLLTEMRNRGVRRYLGPGPALPGTRTADRCRACRGSRPPTRHAHRLPTC